MDKVRASARRAAVLPGRGNGRRRDRGGGRRGRPPEGTPLASRTLPLAAPPRHSARSATTTLSDPTCCPLSQASSCRPFLAARPGMKATAPAPGPRLALPSAAARVITTRDRAQDGAMAHRTSHRNPSAAGLPVTIAAGWTARNGTGGPCRPWVQPAPGPPLNRHHDHGSPADVRFPALGRGGLPGSGSPLGHPPAPLPQHQRDHPQPGPELVVRLSRRTYRR